MVQIFLSTLAYLRNRVDGERPVENYAEEQERWCSDPLSHPALAGMNERQLADLPFEPSRVCRS